jgi:IS1 family transposase
MANILPKETQALVIGSLVEGASIRSVERMTGVHRDTIMRLGARVGNACGKMMEATMRDLSCSRIEIDELWGYVGKHQRFTTQVERSNGFGDCWTYIAVDPDTKVVPCFAVGKREPEITARFMADLASRMKNRIQLSSDAHLSYIKAVDAAFGSEVDYGQIVKTFSSPSPEEEKRKYSPSEVVSVRRIWMTGEPRMDDICTSHVESQNLTLRMHVRRLTRLTNAFSKKLENFRAAIALHFTYYNFVKKHSSVKTTPAIAAGVASRLWTVSDLVELAC